MLLSKYTQAAVDIAQKAGDYILAREQSGFTVEEKFSSYDYVTDVDTGCEAIIKESLHALFPDHGFAGEESGMDEGEMKRRLTHMGEDEYCWVVDPLDGTINFIHHLGGYAVSIALLHHNEVISAAIYLPTLGEMFSAQKDAGAWLNGKPIKVSGVSRMQDAMVSIGVPATNMDYRREMAEQFPKVSMESFNLRILGSAAATIAYVACGKLDAYIELGHHPWDIAAGILLVQEAGGQLSNHKGEPLSIADPYLLASNGLIHQDLVRILGK